MRTQTFHALHLELGNMVREFGYIKTANALAEIYEQDVINANECETLRTLLALEAMEYSEDLADALQGCGKIEINYQPNKRGGLFDEAFEARMNRLRLENNQMTKWVDSPIFDQPQPRLQLTA